jgi:hypothetical protein
MSEITIDDSRFMQEIESLGGLETAIFNDARSAPNPVSGRGGGYPYFYPVDLGRGPVVAKNARALAIPTENGVIFRRSVGPAAPRFIRSNAMGQLEGTCINAAVTSGSQETVRGWFAAFLNKVAAYFISPLEESTPRGLTGKLKSSYRSTVTS